MNTPKALVLMTLFKSPFHEGEKKAIKKNQKKISNSHNAPQLYPWEALTRLLLPLHSVSHQACQY